MATNTTRGEGQAGHDVSRQILLLNPANTPARHKTFEPNIYPNLGLLTLGTSLQQALRQGNIAAQVLYYDGGLLGEDFIRRPRTIAQEVGQEFHRVPSRLIPPVAGW